MGNPLTAVPMKAARWSAEHPWRAILGWIAFVAVAVGLAVAIPTHEATDADYRIGESGRADAMIAEADLDAARHRERPDHRRLRRARRRARPSRPPTPSSPARRRADGVAQRRRRRSGTRTVRRCSSRSSSTTGVDDADAVQAVTDDVQADFPDLQVRAGRRRRPSTPPSTSGSREDLGSAETISLPVTLVLMLLAFGALIAAGIPVLLARHQRRRDDRPAGAAVAPRARRPDRLQHDRADRHGGRRRLLALLPQARARGARRGPHHAGRRRDRRAYVGSLDPGVRRRGDRLDGRPVRGRQRDLQLARDRLDPGRRGRRARLDHRAAGAAGQARPLGRPAAGAAAVAAQPPDRPRRHQQPPARARWCATPWSRSPCRAS